MTSAREWRNRMILLGCTVLFMLVAMELGCRALRGSWFFWHWPNLVLLEAAYHNKPCLYPHDDVVGYAPEPNCSSPEHSHDALGMRKMPPIADAPPNAPLILVTGDSYAYSDEVKDDETWAAYLQSMIHRKIDNGGVPGYGLDQSVLHTEQLVKRVNPGLVVFAFIADDLQRSEMRHLYGAERPYFTLNNGALVLHNSPVPVTVITAETLPFWQRWFGWSMLVDKFIRHFGYYSTWFWQDTEATPPGTGEKLACPLMQRLAALEVPTLVVAQYRPHVWFADKTWVAEQRRLSQVVLKCAEIAGMKTYDTFSLVGAAVKTQGVKQLYGEWHHSAAGNHLVAQGIAAELARRNMLP